MKKIFTLIVLLFIVASTSFAQTILLWNDFAGYTGSPTTVAPGWYYSWNDSTTKSFYISAGNYGISPPSYKFGRDSTTIISPRIQGSPDSVYFWMKGNGSVTSQFSPQNSFSVFESTDSTNWTLNTVIDSMVVTTNGSTDSVSVKFALNSSTAYLKFFYQKFVGNVAFDNLVVTGLYDAISASPSKEKAPVIYPNPSKGMITIDFKNNLQRNVTITFNNVLGMEVKRVMIKGSESNYHFDLSEFQDGVYFIKVKSDSGESTQRIMLRK